MTTYVVMQSTHVESVLKSNFKIEILALLTRFLDTSFISIQSSLLHLVTEHFT